MSREIKQVVLNFADILNNNNKFYEMNLVENDLGSYILTKSWGRLGSKGQQKTVYYSSESDAMKEFNKTYKSKVKSGYNEIELATDEVVLVSKEKEEDVDKYDSNILSFVDSLIGQSMDYVRNTVSTPLGKLSSSQIVKGSEVLDKIYSILNTVKEDKKSNIKEDLLSLSNEFYRYIPFEFGRGYINKDKLVIDEIEKINDRKDLLDAIKSVVETKDISGLNEKYESIGIDLSYVKKDSSSFSRIEDWIKSTVVHSNFNNLSVNNIYQIDNMEGHSEFNPNNIEVTELFHGTRSENVLSIMKTGLKKRPPSNVAITGKMFGEGIYFADKSSKSINYVNSFGRHNTSSKHYLFISEVATGNKKVYYSSESFLKEAPKGYDSVLGKAGNYLRYNEYIVYNDNQVKLKYIVEITF